jgi:hypothetical protein
MVGFSWDWTQLNFTQLLVIAEWLNCAKTEVLRAGRHGLGSPAPATHPNSKDIAKHSLVTTISQGHSFYLSLELVRTLRRIVNLGIIELGAWKTIHIF